MASQVSGLVSDVTVGSTTKQVASKAYGLCETAAGTAAKTVEMTGFDLTKALGVTIHVKFTYSNTADNATLNVNSQGATPLCRYGTTRVGKTVHTSWQAGAVVALTYDGTSFVMNDYIENTDSDTKNTAGATDTSSKIFLVGATAQTANPQTYSDDQVYTTSGTLTTNKVQVGVGQATMEYNSTLKSIDFVFT